MIRILREIWNIMEWEIKAYKLFDKISRESYERYLLEKQLDEDMPKKLICIDCDKEFSSDEYPGDMIKEYGFEPNRCAKCFLSAVDNLTTFVAKEETIIYLQSLIELDVLSGKGDNK